MYGKIISFLFVVLVLYYVVMILLDLQKAKADKLAEAEKINEEDIDITDEAKTFNPIVISREKPKSAQETSSDKNEADGSSESQNEEEEKKKFQREGYREPIMTDGLEISRFIEEAQILAETGKGALAGIIHDVCN